MPESDAARALSLQGTKLADSILQTPRTRYSEATGPAPILPVRTAALPSPSTGGLADRGTMAQPAAPSGGFAAVASTFGKIAAPFARAFGPYITTKPRPAADLASDSGNNPSDYVKGKSANLFDIVDNIPGAIARFFNSDVADHMAALGTDKLSSYAFKSEQRRAGKTLWQEHGDKVAAATEYEALQNSGARTIADLAARGRESLNIQRTADTSSQATPTVVADPSSASSDPNASVTGSFGEGGKTGTPADAQVSNDAAAFQYLTQVRKLNETQAAKIMEWYTMDGGMLANIIGKGAAMHMSINQELGSDPSNAAMGELSYWSKRGLSSVLTFVQEGLIDAQNTQRALKMSFEQKRKVTKEEAGQAIDEEIAAMGQKDWMSSSFMDKLLSAPFTFTRAGGTLTMGTNMAAYAVAPEVSVPVTVVYTILGMGNAIVDEKVYAEKLKQDELLTKITGVEHHSAQDYILGGEQRIAEMTPTERNISGLNSAILSDPFNLAAAGSGAVMRSVMESKAGQGVFWRLAPWNLETPNFLKYVDSGERVRLLDMYFGDGKRVSDTFRKIYATEAEAARAEANLEGVLAANARRIAETAPAEMKTGTDVLRVLRDRLATGGAMIERNLSVEDQVIAMDNWARASGEIDDIRAATKMPLGQRALTGVSKLGANGRGMTPKMAEFEAKNIVANLLYDAKGIITASDVTTALKNRALALESWLQRITPQEERMLQAADMSARTKGYTFRIIDDVTDPNGIISVRDFVPDKALHMATLDAQNIATHVGDFQGMIGLLSDLKARVTTSLASKDFAETSSYLPNLSRELRGIGTNAGDLHAWIVANQGQDIVKDLINAEFGGKLPSLAQVQLIEKQVRQNISTVADIIDQAIANTRNARAAFNVDSAKRLLQGIDLSVQKLSRMTKFTESGKAVVEETIAAARQAQLRLPSTYHAYVADTNAVKNSLAQMVDFSARVLKPLNSVEVRTAAMKRLSQTLHDAGVSRQGIIDAVDATIKYQREGGVLPRFWKTGITSPGSSVLSMLGGNNKFYRAMENMGLEITKLAPAERQLVFSALTKTFGGSIASLYQSFYNAVRFTNPRFMLAETVEQGLVNSARYGFRENYYKAVTDERLMSYLQDYADIRVTNDYSFFGRSAGEIDKQLYGLSKTDPEVAKLLREKGISSRALAAAAKSKSGASGFINRMEAAVGDIRARAFDKAVLTVTRDEAMRVYKAMPQWDDMLARFGSEEGVARALDNFWMEPNLNTLDVKKLVIDELGISIEKQKVVRSIIEQNVRRRLQAAGTVVAKNEILNVLNNPFISPFLAYNWRISKLALRLFTGHGFGVRYGMGMAYVYEHFEDFGPGFDYAKFSQEYPETARLLQYIFIPSNPMQFTASVGAIGAVDNALHGDFSPMYNDVIMRGFVNPSINGWKSIGGSATEVWNGVHGLVPRTGRQKVAPGEVSSFLQTLGTPK